MNGAIFSAVALAVACVFPAAVAAQHPETLGHDPDRGYEWVAASRVLTADGSVDDRQSIHERLREGIDWQLKHSAPNHGFEEGQIPPPESCATRLSYVSLSPPPKPLAGSLTRRFYCPTWP